MNPDSRDGATSRPIFCHGCGAVAVADVVVGAVGELRHWLKDPEGAVRQVRVSPTHRWGTVDRLTKVFPGGARSVADTTPRDDKGGYIRYCPKCLAIACPPI